MEAGSVNKKPPQSMLQAESRSFDGHRWLDLMLASLEGTSVDQVSNSAHPRKARYHHLGSSSDSQVGHPVALARSIDHCDSHAMHSDINATAHQQMAFHWALRGL